MRRNRDVKIKLEGVQSTTPVTTVNEVSSSIREEVARKMVEKAQRKREKQEVGKSKLRDNPLTSREDEKSENGKSMVGKKDKKMDDAGGKCLTRDEGVVSKLNECAYSSDEDFSRFKEGLERRAGMNESTFSVFGMI